MAVPASCSGTGCAAGGTIAVEGDPGVESCGCVVGLIAVSGVVVAGRPDGGTPAAVSLVGLAAGVLVAGCPAPAAGVVCTSEVGVAVALLRWRPPKCCCTYPIARISFGILLRCGHAAIAAAAIKRQATIPICSARRG